MVDQKPGTRLERSKNDAERLKLVKDGDLTAALEAIRNGIDRYTTMANMLSEFTEAIRTMGTTINKWVASAKIDREAFAKSEYVFEGFVRVAHQLLGDTAKSYIAEAGVSNDEVTFVENDSKFAALLARIAKANDYDSARLCKDAYSAIVDAIGRYEAKVAKLCGVDTASGSSANEESVARRRAVALGMTVEVLKKRKDVIVEQSLAARRRLQKFVDDVAINPTKDRELTQDEINILKGL